MDREKGVEELAKTEAEGKRKGCAGTFVATLEEIKCWPAWEQGRDGVDATATAISPPAASASPAYQRRREEQTATANGREAHTDDGGMKYTGLFLP